jgi:predicted metallo-beta-lactamase superfamily hydrolase
MHHLHGSRPEIKINFVPSNSPSGLKILVKPLCAESLGVRSTSTYVETADVRALVDAGAALAPRDGMLPHPLEYRALKAAREKIICYAKRSEVIVVSHYHFDHFTPFFETFDAKWTWCDKNVAEEVYSEKIVYLKDFESSTNYSQRRRGWIFKKMLEKVAKKVIKADDRSFYYGGTTIKFSEPLSHGEEGSRLGFVLATTFRSRDLTFTHASDVQGPISTKTLDLILREKPDILVIGGPPTYLTEVSEKSVEQATANLSRLVEETKLMILDHHLLRDLKAIDILKKLNEKAKKFGNKVQTFAEYQDKKNLLLEAQRKELYAKEKPDEKFLKWVNLPSELQKGTLPPI